MGGVVFRMRGIGSGPQDKPRRSWAPPYSRAMPRSGASTAPKDQWPYYSAKRIFLLRHEFTTGAFRGPHESEFLLQLTAMGRFARSFFSVFSVFWAFIWAGLTFFRFRRTASTYFRISASAIPASPANTASSTLLSCAISIARYSSISNTARRDGCAWSSSICEQRSRSGLRHIERRAARNSRFALMKLFNFPSSCAAHWR